MAASPDFNFVYEDRHLDANGRTRVTGDLLANDSWYGGHATVDRVTAPNGVHYDTGTWVPGLYGRLYVYSGGTYKYELYNDMIQHLGEGQTLTEVFGYRNDGFWPWEKSSSSLTITIAGTNDYPIVTAGGTVTYTENDARTVLAPNLFVSDVDSTMLARAVVEIWGPTYRPDPHDVLTFTNQNGISGSYDAATGKLTLTGTASVADYQAALRSITYHNTSNTPVAGARQVVFTTYDALSSWAQSGGVRLVVNAVNDGPDAVSDSAYTVSLGSASGNVLANDTDVDGTVRTVREVEASAAAVGRPVTGTYGTLVLNADGTYTYTADRAGAVLADNVVYDSFLYQIVDEQGATDTARIYVSVRGRSTGGEGNDTIIGNGSGNVLQGLGGHDTLEGRVGQDKLLGGLGNDRLDGGLDADRMEGGGGNDTYVVDNSRDLVIESGLGVDTVLAGTSYSLLADASVEVLRSASAASTTSMNLFGSNLANSVTGNNGVNTIRGLGGHDKVHGLGGNDTLTGDDGNDVIAGGLGADILAGGIGRDTFVFDTAASSLNVDRLTDFRPIDDTIQLENAVFRGLGEGALAAGAFHMSTSATLAHDADDRIIYDKTTGALYYDANGSAAGGAVKFAQLTAGLSLTQADFVVI